MHKKVIRGTVYYYTSVRENGRVKTIYLGRTLEEALKREEKLKKSGVFDFANVGLKIFNKRFFASFLIIVLIVASFFLFGGGFVGYIVVETQETYLPGEKLAGNISMSFYSEELYPKDSEVMISLGEQSVSMNLSEFINQSGVEVDSGDGDYYIPGSDFTDYGEGFGLKGNKTVYKEIRFSFVLTVYVEENKTTVYNTTRLLNETLFNETTNQTENITTEVNITFNNESLDKVILETLIFNNGLCDFERPFSVLIQHLTNETHAIHKALHAIYNVSIVPDSVRAEGQKIDDDYVNIRIDRNLIIATTDYSQYDVYEGFGKGYENDQKVYLSLDLETFNLTAPNETGRYVLGMRLVYKETVLEETAKNITVEIPIFEEVLEENKTVNITIPEVRDSDGDGEPDETDCEPEDPEVYHGKKEDCKDGKDNNCDGLTDREDLDCLCEDNDGDGYTTCQSPIDCDDNEPEVNPGMGEICDDGVDNNCNGLADKLDFDCFCEDNDEDGYDTCQPDMDCDDTDNDVHPGAKEICGNGIDENCDQMDEACPGLKGLVESRGIEYIEEEVVEEISLSPGIQTRVIIRFKRPENISDLEKNFRVGRGRTVKNFISAYLDEVEMVNVLNTFTEDEIESIQIDHRMKVFMDDVVNQTGVSRVWNSNITGKGQTVCVIDSGIDYNHTNLSDNYIGGYDFISDDSDPMDDHGHGTYVSGIVAGVAPDSKILAVKVFGNDGLGYESDILAGIDYCVNNKETYNISVILMSFGGGIYNTSCYCDSNLVANESNFAVSQGIFMVAASGNDGGAYLKAPACGSNVTSVGAVDKNDSIANFTNIEPLLDLLAPGAGVESEKMGGGMETRSGTSASAAVVAGGACLILENITLSPPELEGRLGGTGVLITHNGTDYPRLDAYYALMNQATNTPGVQQGTQCEGEWEDYEPLAENCLYDCEEQCVANCYATSCVDWSPGSCEDCCEMSGCICSCDIPCGAECETSADCDPKCVGETRYYNDWCDIASCIDCNCVWDDTEVCDTQCRPDGCHEKHCISGNCNYEGEDCNPHDCDPGVGCATGIANCDITCGADCESNNDCNYCSGDTRYYSYTCSGTTCACGGGSTQICSALYGMDLCTTDDHRQYYDAGNCDEGGICDSGTGNPTCHGDRHPGWHADCSDSNACSGSCPGCLYREYYCSGLSCTDVRLGEGPEGVCCATGTARGTGNANCNSYNSLNPDSYTGTCSGGVCCTGCMGAGYWQIGGEAASGTDYCCGDDASEYRITETSGTDAPSPYNTGSGTSCCNPSTDCTESGTDICTPTLTAAGSIPNRAYCGASNTWYGGDASTTACSAIAGAGYWNLGGDEPSGDCCGDDGSGVESRITETSGTDAPSPYNTGSGTSCCNPSTDCTESGTDVCTLTGTAAGSIPNRAYCGASNTWYGGDASTTACTGVMGSGYWNLGGDEPSGDCCGDDGSGVESRITELSAGGDTPLGYNDGTYGCCAPSTDCVYGATAICVLAGDDSGVADPNNAWCCSTGEESCTANRWYGGDSFDAACDDIAGANRWAVGGNGDCTGGSCLTACCEDDNGESYEICVKNAAVAWTCTSSYETCCNVGTDCVDPGDETCITSGSADDVSASSTTDDIAYCSSGTWLDCDLNYVSCTATYCGSGSGVYCGEGASCSIGEYSDNTTLECCGDDDTTEEIYEQCAIGFEIAWSGSCAATDRACCDSTSCVDPTVAKCYDFNSYYDVVGIGAAADTIARCAGGGGWRDCDENVDQCNDAGDCAGIIGGCTSDNCSAPSGESGAFGEYSSFGEVECCGDDNGENFEYCENYAGSDMDWGCTSTDKACCDNTGDCTDNNGNCNTSYNSNPADFGKVVYGLNPGGNDTMAFCYRQSGEGKWLDCDTSGWYNNWCNTTCGPAGGGVTSGESTAFGEYPAGSPPHTTGCCGDDYGENYHYRQAHSSMDNGWVTDTSDDACCDTDDCVAGGKCYENETNNVDVDGDGDNDYCLTGSPGEWYDCNSTDECPAGYICENNNCVPQVLGPTNEKAYMNRTKPLHSELGRINVSWTDNAVNEEGYRLNRSTDNSNWEEIPLGANVEEYIEDDIEDNMKYFYKITAYNDTAGQKNSSGIIYNITADRTKPNSSYLAAGGMSGLVGYWKFSGGVNNTIFDSGWNDNDGTYNGSSLVFNGTDLRSVQVPYDSSIAITGNITIEMWVKGSPNQLSSENIYTIGRASAYAMRVYISGTGNNFGVILNISGGWKTIDTGADVLDNQWHHLVATYNGTDMATYIDGVINETLSQTGSIYHSGTTELYLGTYSNGYGPFNGTLDEVRLYNRSLTAEEVREHQRGNFSDESGLVGLWHFNETTGSTAADASGNGNDGTVESDADYWSGETPAFWDPDGYSGYGLVFNGVGSNQYIEIPDDPSLDITDELTIEAWVKYDGYTIWPTIISKTQDNYRLFTNSGEKVVLRLTIDGSTESLTSTGTVNIGGWTHITAVYNGTDRAIFLNGELDVATPQTGQITDNDYPLIIGNWEGGTRTFNGLIDEVKIYRRALTAEEINRSYQNTKMELAFASADYDLILSMPFEEGSGTRTEDWSSYQNDGNLGNSSSGTQPTWNSSGRYRNGLQFDGDLDFVNISDSPELRLGTDQTVMAWINTKTNPTSWIRIVGKGNITYRNYGMWRHSGGDMLFQIYGTTSCNFWNNGGAGDPANIPDNSGWHHVAGVYNGTGGKLYIDGLAVHSSDCTTTPYTSADSLTIGSSNWAGYGSFNGTIDDVKIFKKALTQREIINEMQSGTLSHGVYRTNTTQGNHTPVDGIWDDFEGSTLDTSIWGCWSGGDCTVSGSMVNVTYDTGAGGVASDETFNGSHLIEWRTATDGNSNGVGFASIASGFTIGFGYFSGDKICGYGQNGPTYDCIDNDNEFHNYKLKIDTESTKLYIDDKFVGENTTVNSSSFLDFTIRAAQQNSASYWTATKYVRVTPLVADNNFTDTSVSDTEEPDVPAISLTVNNDTSVKITWDTPDDDGNSYYYYLKAYDWEGNEESLIENWGFENNGSLDPWTIVTSGDDGTPKVVTDEKLNGKYVAYFNKTEFVAPWNSIITSEYIPVRPGDSIRISLWSKGENIVQGSQAWHKAYLSGRWYDSSLTMITAYPDLTIGDGTGTWDWKRSQAVRTAPLDAAYWKTGSFGMINCTGALWVDDVRVDIIKSKNLTSGFGSMRIQNNITDSWLDVVNTSTTPYTHTGLTPNTHYYYRAYSRDKAGNENSTASVIVSNYTLAQQPSITDVSCGGSMGTYYCNVTFSMGSNPAGTEHYINETTGNTGGTDQDWTTSTAVYQDTGLALATQYCYRIKARNADNIETSYTSETCEYTTTLDITETLDPEIAEPSTTVYVYGHVNLSNGSDVADNPFNIWLNGSLLTTSNLTAHGTYDNDKSLTHTDSGDWDGGTFANTTYDSENVTINDTELDASPGIFGIWHMNNDSSYGENETLVYDFSGNGNNGTVIGGEGLLVSFNMTGPGSPTNSYRYENLSSVGDYTIVAGSCVEYDILWTSEDDKIGFDFTTDGAGQNYLRSTANPSYDQNGILAHPNYDISAYAYHKWYHRKITINESHTGNTIQYYDIACEYDDTIVKTAFIKNITITDCAGTIRKVIYQGGSYTHANHLSNNGYVYVFGSDYEENLGSMITNNGRLGGGFEFDGVDDYIVLEDYPIENTDFTLMAWVHVSNITADNRAVFSKMHGSNNANRSMLLRIGIDGSLVFYTMNSAGTVRSKQTATGMIKEKQWYHVAVSYDKSENDAQLYINGTAVPHSQSDQVLVDITDSPINITIGKWDSYHNPMDGYIDEAAMYTRSLTDGDIAEIYDEQKHGYYYGNGTFESEVMDAGAAVEWKNISWSEPYSYGEHLETESNAVLLLNMDPETGKELSTSDSIGTDLRALYHLNDNDFSDASGYGNDGTAQGGLDCTGNDGVFDDSCDLDGSDDYINVTWDTSLNITENITFGAWVKIDGNHSNSGGMVVTKQGISPSSSGWRIYIYNSNDVVRAEFWNETGDDNYAQAGSGISRGVWHHLVGVYNETEMILYIDGNLNVTRPAAGKINYTTQDLVIGRWVNGGYNFNGSIEEVAVWSRALTESEIVQLFRRGRANDTSGNGNDGQLVGPLDVGGALGNAIEFDGVDDYVRVEDDSTLDIVGNISVEVWMKVGLYESQYRYIVSKGPNLGTYFLRVTANTDAEGGDIEWFIYDGSYRRVNSNVVPQVGEWYHVVGTYNETNQIIYVNGELAGSVARTVTMSTNDEDLTIGSNFNGFIDEVAVYNRTLTASEVKEHYMRGMDLKFQARACSISDCGGISPETNTTAIFHFSGDEGKELEPESDLIGLYHFNDNDLGDFSWESNHGYAVGGLDCTGDDGIFDDSCYFNGTPSAGTYINITGSVPSTSTTELTVAAWAYVNKFNNRTTSVVTPIVSDWNNWTVGWQKGHRLIAFYNKDNYETTWGFTVCNGSDYESVSYDTLNNLTFTSKYANRWIHIAGVYNGTDLMFYINGSRVKTASTNMQVMEPETYTGTWIGRGGVNPGYLNGSVDEVAIWNRSLSDSEILDLYNRGKINDSTTNDRDGQITGPLQADGMVGKALDFDGVDDYTKAGGFSALGTSNQPYSFVGWIKAGEGETDGNIIHVSSNSGGGGWCLPMVALDGGKIRGRSWTGGASSVNSTTTVTSGQWYHFANTWDSTNGLRIYVNGVLENTVSQATYSASGSSNYIWLGFSLGGCNGDKGWFKGSIEEVAVYDKSLSASEIRKIYQDQAFTGPDGTPATYFNSSNGGALDVQDSRYLQYKAYFSTPNGVDTPYLQSVTADYLGVVTDSNGDYNYSFTAPAAEGTYPVKVNTTYASIYGENTKYLTVDDFIISGGHGTTCNAFSQCFYVRDSGGDDVARFSESGFVDVKGAYVPQQSALDPPTPSFIIKNSGGNVVLYINSTGGLVTKGKFQKSNMTHTQPSGDNDLIFAQGGTGDVPGFIDGATGTMYFKGDLHYNSDI